MRFADLLSETLHSLAANKVRSALTVLGIVVGIASVIAMLSLGKGSQVTIEESIQAAGSNLLTVSPSGGSVIVNILVNPSTTRRLREPDRARC